MIRLHWHRVIARPNGRNWELQGTLKVNMNLVLLLSTILMVWGMIALYGAEQDAKNGPLAMLTLGLFGGLYSHHVLQELEGRHKCELDRCDYPAEYFLSFRGPVPVFLGGQRSTFRVCEECAELWESRRDALGPQTCVDIIQLTAQEKRLQP